MPDGSGTRGSLRAVADAGPRIHLDEVHRPEPWELFETLLVPEAVAAELRHHPDAPGASLLGEAPFEVVPLGRRGKARAEVLARRHAISRADASALAHGRRQGVPLLLTDDLDLRDATRAEGLRPVGSVGLVLRAATAGLVTPEEARAALDDLLEVSSLFLTPRLVDRAKDALDDA